MNKNFILALDQGTTSSRAVIFDGNGRSITMAQTEFGQKFPRPGWVEHDANEIWQASLSCAREVIAALGGPDRSAAIGITNASPVPEAKSE